MPAIAVGALLGSLLALALFVANAQSWPSAVWIGSAALLLPGGIALARARPRWGWLPAMLAFWCLAGMALADYQSRLLKGDIEQRALVEATVASMPIRSGAWLTCVAQLTPLRGIDSPPMRVELSWRNAPAVAVGDQWQLLVSLRAPVQRFNPGREAPWRAHLQQRLHAQARVVPSALNQPGRAARASLNAWRARAAQQLRAMVPERDAAALVVALAVGETALLSQQQWRVFNATGISHLVAISGLHVTLFSLLAGAAARRVWRLLPPLQRRWRRESCAALVGVAAAGGYALLAGFSIPTQRTLIMLLAWHLLRGMARPIGPTATLSVALVGVLLLDPLAPLDAGFWLSFVAVGVLLYFTGPATPGLSPWRAMLQTQWLVSAGLMPVTVAIFGSVSLAGLLVNLAAIPAFSLVLVPLVLGATALLPAWPWASAQLLWLASQFHGQLWPWLYAVADNDLAVWRLQPPAWWLVLAVIAVLLALLPWRPHMRASALLALLPALFPGHGQLRDGEFRLTVLDTGRSVAVIMQTRQRALLFDNGESWGSGGATARATLLPALRALRVRRLDRLIMPRLDRDRAAGLVALAAEFPIGQWQLGHAVTDPEMALARLPPEFQQCTAGHWYWNGVRATLLGDRRCTLRIVGADGTTVLLPTELDVSEQRQLAATPDARCDVLVVPRNGSAAGYGAALRDAARPRVAILANSAVGAAAQTVQSTMAAWRDAGTRVLVTGDRGAIELRAGLDPPRLRGYRPRAQQTGLAGDKALFRWRGLGIMPGELLQPE